MRGSYRLEDPSTRDKHGDGREVEGKANKGRQFRFSLTRAKVEPADAGRQILKQ